MFKVDDRVQIDTLGYGTIIGIRNSDDPLKRHVLLYNVKVDDTSRVDYLCEIIEAEKDGFWEVTEHRLKPLNKYNFIIIAKPVIIEAVNREQAKIQFVHYLERELKIVDFLGKVE